MLIPLFSQVKMNKNVITLSKSNLCHSGVIVFFPDLGAPILNFPQLHVLVSDQVVNITVLGGQRQSKSHRVMRKSLEKWGIGNRKIIGGN